VAGGEYYYYVPRGEQLFRVEGEGLRDDNVLRMWKMGEMVDDMEGGYQELYALEDEQRVIHSLFGFDF
jgi:hypothetical protein